MIKSFNDPLQAHAALHIPLHGPEKRSQARPRFGNGVNPRLAQQSANLRFPRAIDLRSPKLFECSKPSKLRNKYLIVFDHSVRDSRGHVFETVIDNYTNREDDYSCRATKQALDLKRCVAGRFCSSGLGA